MSRKAGRLGAPIGVQLVALLVACLLATHLITFVAVVVTPPPRPPLYRVSEIAAALNGGSLEARFGRPMTRATAQALPGQVAQPDPGSPHAAALAEALGRPVADVRLVPRPPSLLERVLHGPGERRFLLQQRDGRRDGRDGRRDGRDPDRAPDRPMGMGGDRPPPEFRFRMMRGETPVFGDFTAAVRRADGGWTIVRPSPEPFPNDWQRRALLILAAGFAVVAPAGFLFARRITAPLKRFSEAAERLGRDPRSPPVELSGPAEIGVAAEAFNDMQARLKRYVDDRTAMVGAISHDLRTPLARIRFKMENAPGELRGSVLGDVAQMEQMIQGVLTFIRDESTPRHREKLDLLSLVECVADDAAMVGGDVELEDGEPVTVEGDAVALQRLFANLVDNAVKYGREARIRVRRDDGHAVVEIADAGDGLPPEDLERVFQPFYRADASRNLDGGGIGLGLPIARATARAHGGDVVLARGEAGLTAKVTLPVA